jgi:hypothetical protein
MQDCSCRIVWCMVVTFVKLGQHLTVGLTQQSLKFSCTNNIIISCWKNPARVKLSSTHQCTHYPKDEWTVDRQHFVVIFQSRSEPWRLARPYLLTYLQSIQRHPSHQILFLLLRTFTIPVSIPYLLTNDTYPAYIDSLTLVVWGGGRRVYLVVDEVVVHSQLCCKGFPMNGALVAAGLYV